MNRHRIVALILGLVAIIAGIVALNAHQQYETCTAGLSLLTKGEAWCNSEYHTQQGAVVAAIVSAVCAIVWALPSRPSIPPCPPPPPWPSSWPPSQYNR